MKNKLISLSLVFALAFTLMLTFTGCGNDDYPVEVGNLVIEEEPENIVILDPSTADIISYIGYDVKMVGRSEEVNQDGLSIVPTVGSKASPDVDKIKEYDTDIVFAGEDITDDARQSLEDSGITVVTMSQAVTTKQLQTNYLTLGKILGGKVTGANEGTKAYDNLLKDMETVKTTVNASKGSDVLYTVCYLFTENNQLKMMTSSTYGDLLLSYTGAVNTAVNIEDSAVDVSTLKIANPNFVFYDSDQTLQAIKSDSELKQLTAIKNGNTLMITSDEMNRQGYTALDTLQKMVDFMYPQLAQTSATVATSAADTTQAATSAEATKTTATQPTTTVAGASVADEYGIKIDDKLSLKAEDENDNVKAMQQRLFDLGYVTDEENITGYYGEVSQAAVKAFQTRNDIKATGTADNATLVAMFNENAVKAK